MMSNEPTVPWGDHLLGLTNGQCVRCGEANHRIHSHPHIQCTQVDGEKAAHPERPPAPALEDDIDALRARVLRLKAQIYKMAEWLNVERRIAEESVRELGRDSLMGTVFWDRINQIDALLDGSAGESLLADLVEERNTLRFALTKIKEWDCLNPAEVRTGPVLTDLPWLKRTVDDALAGKPYDMLTTRDV